MLILRTLLAASALLLVGCGTVSPSASAPEASTSQRPDYVWPLPAGDWGDLRLLVYDDAALLVGIRAAAPVPDSNEVSWWVPLADEPNSLVLGWVGGVCADSTLRISQEGDMTFLVVSEGAFLGAPGEVCPAVGIGNKVVLTFRDPVSTLGVSFRLSR
jgi:hypothetical protein